jgi:peptidoglycan/LPS O-acetylase OafA/YrhL
VILTIVMAALVVDFRLRIALALVIALLLGFSRRTGLLETWPDSRPLAFLGQISYSLFLVHFPVLLLANCVYALLGLSSALSVVFALMLTMATSIAVATLFYRWIEGPEASQRITAGLGRLSTGLGSIAQQAARLARRAILGRA